MDFSKTSVAGNGNLLIEGMQSPNFSVLTGTGWQINKDGSATFYSISLPNFPGSGSKVTFSGTAPPSPNVGDVWYDTAAGLLAQQWNGSAWVPYMISAGALASGDTVNPNPYFAGGDTANWFPTGGAVLAGVATSGLSYPYAGQVTAPAGSSFPFVNGPLFPVNAGDPVQVNGWINSNCLASLQVSYYNSSGSFLSDDETDVNTGSAWQYIAVTGTVPAGAVSASLSFGINLTTTTGPEVVLATGLTVFTKINGTLIEANTITADQIEAGTVVAGIIDGTTISAATFEGTNWLENSAGQFMYSGTPTLGNLILSIAPSATSDPFGNSVPAGVWIYFGNDKIGLFNQGSNPALILVPDSPTATLSPTILAFTSAHATATEQQWAVWTSGKESGNNDAAIQLASASADNSLPAKIVIEFGGAVAATWELATGLIADSWHDITLDTGWTAGAQAPQYRLLPDGNVQVRGTATHAGTTAAVNINNSNPIPAAYRPSQNRVYRPPISQDTAGTVQIATTGVFAMRASGFSATQAIMDGIYAV